MALPASDHDLLVELIYAAVEDSSRWIAFLEAFTKAVSVRSGFLWITRLDRPLFPSLTASFGTPPDLLTQMAQPDYCDPWLSRIDLSTVPVGSIMRSNEIASDEVLLQDPWYQRLCLPYDYHYGGGVLLALSPTLSAGMSCNRGRSAGPLTENEVAIWQRLIPHLIRAVAMAGWRAKIDVEGNALIRYFDGLSQGMILATPSCEILASNRQADSIIERNDCLLSAKGRLRAVGADSQAVLQQAVLQTGEAAAPDPVQFTLRGSAEVRVLVTILPWGQRDESNLAVEPPATALIWLTSLSMPFDFDPAPLRHLFGFTAAEARLACRLATGDSLAEAANRLNVSLNTVRTHLQRAFNKAGLHRQAELVALVLRTSLLYAPEAKSSKRMTTA